MTPTDPGAVLLRMLQNPELLRRRLVLGFALESPAQLRYARRRTPEPKRG